MSKFSHFRLMAASGLIITSGILFSACTGPEIPNDQLKLSSNQNNTQTERPKMDTNNPTPSPTIAANTATLNTSKGVIKIKLYGTETPATVQNFAQKAVSKFYENLTFHRVEDWVVQGGDPKGNGTGGGQMPTELTQHEFKTGSVGVARGGDIRVSNDAQFFICTKDCAWLTGQYTNFGEVIEGMDVVNKIEIGDKIINLQVE